MARQLNVRNDEAYETATSLAKRLHTTTTDVVLRALRKFASDEASAHGPMTEKQRRDYEALRSIVDEVARHKLPGATSDHSDMYDEFGLPK
ncbi:MAG TPA: type II toxin-antitoxin system VapB family antitoxin [Rhodoblastus sp.]|nr:type II toxin-antitoxin system VapB family antitoxin [Rhodoblastus sp.]